MHNGSFSITPRQDCEWGKARIVLMHEPGIETLFGVLNPHSSNFLRGFSIEKALVEHRNYRREIEKNGVKVFDILELLTLEESLDKEYKEFRKYIEEVLEVRFTRDIKEEDRRKVISLVKDYIEESDLRELLDILLLKPTLNISYNDDALDETTKFYTTYTIDPAHNLLYMRDPLITTRKGITIGRYRLKIRRRENDIVDNILRYAGIKPIYRVSKGFLEGGDFIPAKDFVLQGVGLLTNMDGAVEAIENRVYGDVEIGLVLDPSPHMEEMHLDGYLGILSEDLAVLSETRLNSELEPDVLIYRYEERSDDIKKVGTLKLTKYLREWGYDIVEVPLEDHNNLAENFLLLDKMKLIGVSKVGLKLRGRLEELGVKATYIEMDNLLKGYGGPHCLTQVILREKC